MDLPSPMSTSSQKPFLDMVRRQLHWCHRFNNRTIQVVICFLLAIVLVSCLVFLPIYFARSSTDYHDGSGRGSASGSRSIARLILPKIQTQWMSNCSIVSSSSFDSFERFDCHPEAGITLLRCRNRGCCWMPTAEWNASTFNKLKHFQEVEEDVKSTLKAKPPPPSPCIYPSNYGYIVSGPEEQFLDGWEMPLARLNAPSRYGDDTNVLRVRIEMQTTNRLRIKFYNPMEEDKSIPDPDPVIPVEKPAADSRSDQTRSSSTGQQPNLYAVSYRHSNVPFGLQVRRVETGTVIFNTSLTGMTFASQFIQLSTKLPSKRLYGFGPLTPDDNQTSDVRQTWSIFSGHTQDNEHAKIHGGHPMYMCVEEDGRAHGVLLHTSFPLDMLLQPTPPPASLTYRTLGGNLDFYLFLGPTPEDVIKQYTEAVGRPFLPPYWSLGFQISHVGVKDIQAVQDSLRDVERYNVPFDVVTLAGEYKSNRLDFTLDHRRFPSFLVFVDKLSEDARYVDMDVDPALSMEQPPGTYPPYDEARRYGLLVNSSVASEPVTGQTSSGKSAFVDFGNPGVVRWWKRNIEQLRGMTRFHSLSLVENFPSNWRRNDTKDVCVKDYFNHPPYIPRALAKSRLYWHTICMDGLQWQEGKRVHHYTMHNKYGHDMAKVIYKEMTQSKIQQRACVVSQSTFTGSGKYTGYWMTDNSRTWKHLKKSIDTVLTFNIYGVPLVGSAICGMDVEAEDSELCTRWIQLGAFYPLARMVHDPIFCKTDFGKAARNAMTTRYKLLPYLYTLFYKASTEGGTVARPLFHEFHSDEKTYDIKSQFMWGSGLMIVPTLTKGDRLTEIYLPHAIWYIYHTGARIDSCGEFITMESPLDQINLFVRGGSIIPTQPAGLTTTESRKNNFHLLVALDEHRTASGQFYWDDGNTQDTHLTGEYILVNFTVYKNKLIVSGQSMKPLLQSSLSSAYFDRVDIMGLPYEPRLIAISGTAGVLGSRQYSWDPRSKVVKLKEVILPLTDTVEIYWRFTD